MRRFALLATLAATTLTLAAADFSWTGAVAPGQTLEIKGVNGGIHAELAPGGQIEVTATKTARHSDPNSVRIDVVPSADGVTICAVYPNSDSTPNTCQAGRGGHMNIRDNDVNVEFTVKVPAGVRFVPKSVNGDVIAKGLRSDIDAHSVNGKIDVGTSGIAQASTVNGSVTISMGTLTWNRSLEFSSVNGSIEITLPAGISADVKATTVNGGIYTDFPLTVSGRFGPRSINGRLGGGGQELKMTTVNGSVSLKQGDGRAL